MTGLAAGFTTRAPVFEARDFAGGICSSYYRRPGHPGRLFRPPDTPDAFRFEIGGGHWIFGGDPEIIGFLSQFCSLKSYARRSAVRLAGSAELVPYPLQYHLGFLSQEVSNRALKELNEAGGGDQTTMQSWFAEHFGASLGRLFFEGFQERYTAGLWSQIAPQDHYKNPVDLKLAAKGASGRVPATGYNATFVYPEEGLDGLSRNIAADLDIHFGKKVVQVDLDRHLVRFHDGSSCQYERLISTLPLNRMGALTGLDTILSPDPYTSVLVFNIGGEAGPAVPEEHWIYIPDSLSGFHRVGLYSNVDRSFLPEKKRKSGVSFYVETAFRGGARPDKKQEEAMSRAVVNELQEWGYLKQQAVVDPTWIEVAYTWRRPGSSWREDLLELLEKHDVFMRGRYARWQFQGIAASLREGLSTKSLV